MFLLRLFGDSSSTATAGLVVTQVLVGIAYQAASLNGAASNYTFSPSSAVAISEFLKLCISTTLFWRECRRKETHDPVEVEEEATEIQNEKDEPESSEGSEASATSTKSLLGWRGSAGRTRGGQDLSPARFLSVVKEEAAEGPLWGYIKLALLYSYLNITIFISYKKADPASINLIKAGTLPLLAMNDFLLNDKNTTIRQWGAVAIQMIGLVISQYHSTLSASTYLLLISQMVVSTLASIYSSHLTTTSSSSSPHIRNMQLYCTGMAIAFLSHHISNVCLVDQPGFFTGYGDTDSLWVLFCNVLIGQATIRIQNSAGIFFKSIATAMSASLLLYLCAFFFYTHVNLLIIPGSAIILGTTYTYLSHSEPSSDPPTSSTSTRAKKIIKALTLNVITPQISTAIQSILTLFVITSLLFSNADIPTTLLIPVDEPEAPPLTPIYSPFNNTLLMTRITKGELTERIDPLRKYAPLFHTHHISKPPHPDHPEPSITTTPTYSNFPGLHNIYLQVGELMSLILSESASNSSSPLASINGLFYMHFDFWLDPLAFNTMDFSKLWILDRDGPTLHCMTNPAEYRPDWQGITGKWYEAAQRTNQHLQSLDLGYKIHPQEFCIGWADAYYVPRQYFADFALLARAFGEREGGLDHEMAIATIFRIIQQTHKKHKYMDVMEHVGDCWGGCCTGVASEWDLLWHRCGHRINWLDPATIKVQERRLAAQTRLVNGGWNGTKEERRTERHDEKVEGWLRREGVIRDQTDEEEEVDEEGLDGELEELEED